MRSGVPTLQSQDAQRSRTELEHAFKFGFQSEEDTWGPSLALTSRCLADRCMHDCCIATPCGIAGRSDTLRGCLGASARLSEAQLLVPSFNTMLRIVTCIARCVGDQSKNAACTSQSRALTATKYRRVLYVRLQSNSVSRTIMMACHVSHGAHGRPMQHSSKVQTRSYFAFLEAHAGAGATLQGV